jgi:hypothetical protein
LDIQLDTLRGEAISSLELLKREVIRSPPNYVRESLASSPIAVV